MILHLAFNTFLVFLVLAGSIELLLFLFGIKNGRLRTICRLLPVAKLPFDFLIFGLYGESFLMNLNPFSCEIFFNDTLRGLLPLGEGNETSMPTYIASKWPPFFVKTLIFGITTLSAYKVLRRWAELIRSSRFVKKIRRTSSLCQRPILNEHLKNHLEQKKVTILVSPSVQVPFAAGCRLIVFPESLMVQLSQAEFESIVSHEFEHLKWKDPVVKVASYFFCSLFWWIPTKWWIKRLEMEQEKASDSGIYKYNIESLSLAQAFVKAAAHIRSDSGQVMTGCPFASKRDRLEHILNLQKVTGGKLKWALLLILCLLVFCSVWSC